MYYVVLVFNVKLKFCTKEIYENCKFNETNSKYVDKLNDAEKATLK